MNEQDQQPENPVFHEQKKEKILCILLFQTSVQVPSPAAGVIEELLVPDGGKVEGGTPLFKLRKGGEQLLLYYCINHMCKLHAGVISAQF